MINNFSQVDINLYRGSAPSISDVDFLHNDLDVNKIVSLDQNASNRINRTCKLLGINHITIPIDIGDKMSLLKFLNTDIIDLLSNDNGAVFVHCLAGKDRSGLAIGLYRAEQDHWKYEDIIKEANSFGFGLGINPNIINLYKKILQQASKNNIKDNNALDYQDFGYDMVSNQREYPSNYNDYSLDSFEQGSWSSYEDYRVREFPYANVDGENEQDNDGGTRNTYKLDNTDALSKKPAPIPQVGEIGDAQIMNGFGPSLVGSGII